MTAATLDRPPTAAPPEQPRPAGRWYRPALAGLLLGTAVLYLWGLGESGWANSGLVAGWLPVGDVAARLGRTSADAGGGRLGMQLAIGSTSHGAEVLVLTVANLVVMVMRFVAMRGWVFSRRPPAGP
jgi:hypothetical protein